MTSTFSRRALLSSVSVAATLTACTDDIIAPTSPSPSSSPTSSAAPDTPFGTLAPAHLRVAIFDGGYGTGYAHYVADSLQDRLTGVTVAVTGLERISDLDLAADPPDVVNNSGAGALPIGSMLDQLEPLNDLVDAPNLEGTPIKDTLYSSALSPGTFDGRLLALNYVFTVYGLWYSASLFEERGWSLPATWDEMLELGELASKEQRYLFAWSPDAATYYLELAISSAIKESGDEVRRALDGVAGGAWQHPAVLRTLTQLEECVRRGFMQPVDPDAGYLATQATWSLEGRSLLYPSGAWIEREMLDQTAEGFRMTCGPGPTLTSSPTMPHAAIHASAAEAFVVPKAAASVVGGKEFLRTMLSRDAAAHFAVTNLVPTIVKDTVPADTGSTSLGAQTRMLAEAGDHVFSWRFISHYGLQQPFDALMTRFLSGDLTTEELTVELQRHTDEVRDDPAIELYTVE
ncbi:N-acetylglucosamine/diacetylchitobiose ABC transporter substrate-binding protein [Tessaracoccus caeni]|uniref:N-acetylglucosamine/diacetylchitobiose ABC transporter substrate-binding protein n=1 Tax=Tessaracoccus caeni TaxID=3031239 RepID=UPI0023DB2D76|nr:N-acetylglucosamine/diacetylchitobiose ABC transporter substrate-binding protein [Tessaracoccus caeni]MDF1487623.1 N-acetylglucosamine/diacetylchitobiose ABC transporter substrate-binding protein [Tessaracoccus caeni]